jgi:hypothetical protein
MIDLRCRIMERKYARSAFGQRKRFRPASLLFRQYEPTTRVHEVATGCGRSGLFSPLRDQGATCLARLACKSGVSQTGDETGNYDAPMLDGESYRLSVGGLWAVR